MIAAKSAELKAPNYEMRIHKVTITASPSASSDPNDMRNFTWEEAAPVEDLEMAISILQSFIVERKEAIAKPIEL